MSEFRMERDSLGEIRVPAQAYYGAQTARAVENFPISGWRFPRRFIHALGLIKRAAATVNTDLALLDLLPGRAIVQAAGEVVEGRWDDQFVVDIFQTGSGTSTNMNANEVIARRARELLGPEYGSIDIHPNDHVNLSQSSNDVIPTAIHLATASAISGQLLPALTHLQTTLQKKAAEFDNIIKSGRTHLMDATPVRLGQEFGGFAEQIAKGSERVLRARAFMFELPLGGTAVGTGLNCHPEFPARAIRLLSEDTGLPFQEARNHFEAQSARDACVEVSGALKTLAVSLMKIANDVRWMASGPLTGLAEINLPAVQPGSSIMPGKVNPVICEAVMMVAAQVIGYDATISVCSMNGNFELNTMMPLLAYDLLQAVELLSAASRVFADRTLSGITANADRCRELVESNPSIVTALAPLIGYDKAAALVKEALASGRTIRQTALAWQVLPEDRLDAALDLRKMTEPGSA